jgi:hypothetical protein
MALSASVRGSTPAALRGCAGGGGSMLLSALLIMEGPPGASLMHNSCTTHA